MSHPVKPEHRSDGRSARWTGHRERRRAELVEAAVAAIDRHGPTAGLAEIAAQAGVSKPVLYRYFADKADLHRAVGGWGAALVLDRLAPALFAEATIRERVVQGTEAYLTAIEEHPNVFLLLTSPGVSGTTDPLAEGKAVIAAAIARVLGDALRELDLDAGGAVPWSHGVVGLGLATAEWWLRDRTMSRAAVAGYLSSIIWHAFAGVAGEHGAIADESGRLEVVR